MLNKAIIDEKRIEHRIGTAFIMKCTYISEKKNIISQNKKNSFYSVCKNISSVGLKMICEDKLQQYIASRGL